MTTSMETRRSKTKGTFRSIRVYCLYKLLHGIIKGRVYNIQQSFLTSGKLPKDQRGKHDNGPMKYPSPIHNIIVKHIQSFHARSSHYSLRYNPDRKYLPESLTISKMHEMSILTQEFNIKFGFPRSYTCSNCDTLALKINNPECFTEARKNIETEKKIKRYFEDKLGLTYLKTNAAFYNHQLWCNMFGVHDLGSDSVSMFTYHEGDGRKGSNEMKSMLLTYINNNNEPLGNLVLISDNCCGQNKIETMVHFLFTLVHCFHVFKTVTYLFPVGGHSYLPNDEDFSLIDKNKRYTEYVELPEEWDSIIQEARKKPSPFSVVNMHYHDFANMKAAMDDYFSKSPKPPLKIKSAMRDTRHVPWQTCTILKKSMPAVLDSPSLYATYPPIASVKKKKDLQHLMPFVKPENKMFYEDLISG
ncbi:hypothetical protein PR048_005281 [Dryococelus australis]|uniref:DUF7869 domain-containing protein n=1 Tax=Dryococelus australis TaxID=614101 RepID=A0ABQ9I7T8_9NEOP|nr:hypothetical protein PR048_005281 [Dryococelus australis]